MRKHFIQRSEYCLNSVATSAEVARYARRHDIPAARYVSHDMFRVAERYSIEKFPHAEIYLKLRRRRILTRAKRDLNLPKATLTHAKRDLN